MPPVRHLRLVSQSRNRDAQVSTPPTLAELLEQRAALLEAQVRTVVGLGALDEQIERAERRRAAGEG